MKQISAFRVLVASQSRHKLGTSAWQFALSQHFFDYCDSFLESLHVSRLDALFHLDIQGGSDSTNLLKAVFRIRRTQKLGPLAHLLWSHDTSIGHFFDPIIVI